MLYEVRDCCDDLVAMISSLEELEEIKKNHSCYKYREDGFSCACGAYGCPLELRVYQVDDSEDSDVAYQEAAEYSAYLDACYEAWEQMCRKDPELRYK